MNINVNSGDGNSIFDIAHRYQQMQIKELMKGPDEVRQKIPDISDTGSSKFIEDFDKVNNLLFQLKAKTNFKIEDVSDKKEQELDRIASESLIDGHKVFASFSDKLTLEKSKGIMKEIKEKDPNLTGISATSQIVFAAIFMKVLKAQPDKKYVAEHIKTLDQLYISPFEKSLLTPEAVSTEAYSRLAGVSDTIPNIIGSVLSIISKLKSEISVKYMQWAKEINQPKMIELIDQAKKTQVTYIELSDIQAVADYGHIYKKIEKPLDETVGYIFKMGSDMGISGNADVAGFVELKNATKITPDIQIQLKAYIDETFTKLYQTTVDEADFITSSRKVIRDIYLPFIDINDLILNYIKLDVEIMYPELPGQLDDIIIEIQERAKNKKELSGSGKSRTYKRKDLDLFVRTFDMKRFL